MLEQDRFTVAYGTAEHWGAAAKTCLDGLGPDRAKGANIGFLYATDPFANDLGSIVTFLRETTRIETWVGGIVPGLCVQSFEFRDTGALGIMVGTLPEGSFTPFSTGDWAGKIGADTHAAILHGDPRHPLVLTLCEDMKQVLPHMAGGLVSAFGPEHQAAGTVIDGGGSGLLLGAGVELIIGLSQGCSPIGPAHFVTKAQNNVIIELDGLPALDVFKSEAGDLIARDLRRAAGYIHVGLIEGKDYTVRTLVGLDPAAGLLAVGAETAEGEQIVFVRRDANTAHADLSKMLDQVRKQLKGRTALGALYFSCIARGVHMFGEDGAEMAAIRAALDDIPLLGFFANGEIADGHLYGYTGVLAVFVAP